jgi:hypothetical protein
MDKQSKPSRSAMPVSEQRALHINVNDAGLVVVIDAILSFLLQRNVSFPVYLGSMFVLCVCSVAYVSFRAKRRYEKSVESIRRVFGD